MGDGGVGRPLYATGGGLGSECAIASCDGDDGGASCLVVRWCGMMVSGWGWKARFVFLGGEVGRWRGGWAVFGFTTADFGFRLPERGEAWKSLMLRIDGPTVVCLASREAWREVHCRNDVGSCNSTN